MKKQNAGKVFRLALVLLVPAILATVAYFGIIMFATLVKSIGLLKIIMVTYGGVFAYAIGVKKVFFGIRALLKKVLLALTKEECEDEVETESK